MIKSNKTRSGFTLVELLVVIAIIGILAGTVMVSLATARARGRDGRRVADIQAFRNALELYFNEENNYPADAGLTLSGQHLCSGGANPGWQAACDSDQEDLVATSLAPVPPDNPALAGGPCDDATNAYLYSGVNDGAGYNVSFCVGSPTGNLPSGQCVADESNIHCP